MSTSKPDLSVADIQLPLDRVPVVRPTTMFKEMLEAMTRCRLGIACIVDEDGRLLGIFTDGDVRRMLLRDQKPFSALFADDAIVHANKKPTVVRPDTRLSEAIGMMEKREIWDLPVVGADNRLTGLLHLHPALKRVLGL